MNDPNKKNIPTDGFYVIQGFYDANGKNSTWQRFQVVDADESTAARKNYTEQIGFFMPEPPTRGGPPRGGIGSTGGRKESVEIEGYTGGMLPGKMMAVVNIRYLTPEALKELKPGIVLPK